jgi:hypothetical protein
MFSGGITINLDKLLVDLNKYRPTVCHPPAFSLRDLLPLVRGFQVGNDDLFHSIHCLHYTSRLGWIRIPWKLHENCRNDLPRKPIFIFEPTADIWFAALGKFIPKIVDFVLRFDTNKERYGFVEFEFWAAVERNKFLPIEFERHCHNRACREGGAFAVMRHAIDLGILED